MLKIVVQAGFPKNLLVRIIRIIYIRSLAEKLGMASYWLFGSILAHVIIVGNVDYMVISEVDADIRFSNYRFHLA
jgi:hypothetical protein